MPFFPAGGYTGTNKGGWTAVYEEAAQRLADKFGVSVDRAHAALLLAQGDILDAALLLERESPTQTQRVSSWSTANGGEVPARPAPAPGSQGWERVWSIVKGIFLHPTANCLEVGYPGGGGLNVPILVLGLLLLVAFWITTLLLGLGWVLGCRFTLRGPEVDIPQANRVLDQAHSLMQKWRKGLGL